MAPLIMAVFVSFMVVGSSIPAIDGASGLFLGCGLLSFETSCLFVMRSRASSPDRVEISPFREHELAKPV